MGGLTLTAKYNIHVSFEVDGIVEKPDVIGAIFGQTEGLLGDELDLRELQKTGRIGRIQVQLNSKGGKTVGKVIIPSSLGRIETALIAAAIETIDKVGPCSARFELEDIEDAREEKRRKVIKRAKEILLKWERDKIPETKEIIDKILKEIRAAEIVKYGSEGLPAGPDIDQEDTIIIVEGRADVLNLLKHGYRNAIAIEGTSIPKTIIELSKSKRTIAFVDGDRAGELILKELLQVAEIDYIARAPPGREVEELTAKELAKCLSNIIPAKEYLSQIEKTRQKTRVVYTPPIPKRITEKIKELEGTLEAILYDDKWNEINKIPVRNLAEELKRTTHGQVYGVIFDGVVTQRIIDIAGEKNIKIIIGARIGNITKRPVNLTVLSFKDILHNIER